MKSFAITGHIKDTKTNKGVSNLKVEAWDKDLLFDDLVGSAITDASGDFCIEFSEAHFRECFMDRKPDLFFKVYRGRSLIASTEKSVFWNIKKKSKNITIEVELPPKEQLRRLAKIDNLDDAKIARVVEKAGHATLVGEKLLVGMVEAGELTESEAKSLGLTVTLYNLLDDNLELVKTLKTDTYSSIPSGKIYHLEDLVSFDKADWLDILEQTEVQPPEGWSRKDYAALLAKKIENLYPSKVMLARMASKAGDSAIHDINDSLLLFEKNERPFSTSFDDLNLAGVDETTVDRLRTSHTRLMGLANTYPGLEIHTILNNPQVSADDKAKQIQGRIALITRFHSQNPEKEFLSLDYSPESANTQALDFNGFSEDQQRMVLKTVKAFQRIYSVTRDSNHAQLLLSTGYHSPVQIANVGQQFFISSTGLDESVGKAYYEKAGTLATKSVNSE